MHDRPIDLTSGHPVYLSLYGTGFRGSPGVGCQVGGKAATIQYIGPQPTFPGLDQLNLLLPQSLSSGQVTIKCQFFRQPNRTYVRNTVQIGIK
jgi:uncharacterized protein (TIGR03437 family)